MPSSTPTSLRSVFFNEVDMVCYILDKDLNIIDANDTTLKTFRFKREDLIGKNLSDVSPDNKSSGRFEQYMEVIRTGKTLVIDEMKPHPSLGNFHFRIKVFKIGDGLAVVSKDITDLKETIDELETFIYKSSHDMRAPISSILGLVNLVNAEAKSLEDAKEYCVKVKQQIERLDNILHSLIETTRIRQGEKTIYLIDFDHILDDVLKSLEFTKGFKELKIEKNMSLNQKFYSDKILVTLLFQNLIDNAIKYRNGAVDCSFLKISAVDENGGVKITFEDNGIGIKDNIQNEVFKMFFRGTSNATGSGLGLYTVNHTIKKLEGQINLSSKHKIGTTFTVYLPNELKKRLSAD